MRPDPPESAPPRSAPAIVGHQVMCLCSEADGPTVHRLLDPWQQLCVAVAFHQRRQVKTIKSPVLTFSEHQVDLHRALWGQSQMTFMQSLCTVESVSPRV